MFAVYVFYARSDVMTSHADTLLTQNTDWQFFSNDCRICIRKNASWCENVFRNGATASSGIRLQETETTVQYLTKLAQPTGSNKAMNNIFMGYLLY
jgi:hypothetical protein